MSRKAFVIVVLLVVLFAGATAALLLGVQETRLALNGKRQDLAAEEVTPATHGYLALFGCLRHDLALVVSRNAHAVTVTAVGAPVPGSEGQGVYTPLTARDDCEEGAPPKKIFALVEEAEADNTIGRVYKDRVAPPPVPAFVEGVMGYGTGDRLYASRAAQSLGSDLDHLPILAKGRHPGVLWVAVVTALAGLHGYALIVVVVLWSRRRARRDADRSHFSDDENEFYDQT